MFIVGGVVDAGRQQGNRRFFHLPGRQGAKHLQELLPVVFDRLHVIAPEDLGKGAADGIPARQHVRDPRRHPEVVFQHLEAVPGPYDVAAAYRYVDAERNVHPFHFGAVVRAAAHEVLRHRAVAQNVPLVVDVRQKEVQRLDALDKSTFNVRPFPGAQEAGNAVDGESPLDGRLVPIDGEGNALVEKGAGHAVLQPLDLFLRHPAQFVDEHPVVGVRLRCGLKRLVEKSAIDLVALKEKLRRVVVPTRAQPARIACGCALHHAVFHKL